MVQIPPPQPYEADGTVFRSICFFLLTFLFDWRRGVSFGLALLFSIVCFTGNIMCPFFGGQQGSEKMAAGELVEITIHCTLSLPASAFSSVYGEKTLDASLLLWYAI